MRSLRWDMDSLAVDTWRHVAAGDARDIRLREDTLTELNLLELDIRHHPRLRVHRFNQNAEKRSGGDWEWYIGTGVRWFALRIQAKRMDDMEYRQLQHPGNGNDDYQYDTLLRNSASQPVRTFPYYVFYNGWSAWPPGVNWFGCPNGNPLERCSHAADLEFGCAAMPAGLVKAVHRGRGVAGRRVNGYLPFSVPWSWLFGVPERSRLVAARIASSRAIEQSPNTVRPPLRRMPSAWVQGLADTLNWDIQFDAPTQIDEWGGSSNGDGAARVDEIFAWHKTIAEAASSIDDLARSEGGGPRESWERFWPSLIRQSVETRSDQTPTFDDLGPLPEHAQAVLNIPALPDDADPRETGARLRGFDRLFGDEQRTVIVTDLGGIGRGPLS